MGFEHDYMFSYRHNNEWNEQKNNGGKKSIIKEYDKIHEDIIETYF
jgi:hypothetical protein